MSTSWFKRAVVLVAGVALSAGVAFAKDHDFDKGRHERWERGRHERWEGGRHERWEGARHERRMEDRREHFRDNRRMERERWRERREHERMRAADHRRDHRTPSGWDQGQKAGWRGASVPPRQGMPKPTQVARAGSDPRHSDHHGR